MTTAYHAGQDGANCYAKAALDIGFGDSNGIGPQGPALVALRVSWPSVVMLQSRDVACYFLF